MASTLSPPKPEESREDPDRVPALLAPGVDFVARIRARLETKLLAGFLAIAVLMLGLGVVGLFVIERMENQVDRLERLDRQSQNARDMIYLVTAQSHFRAMALLTGDELWNDKISRAKADFVTLLDETESLNTGVGSDSAFTTLRAAEERFETASARVFSLYQTGDLEEAQNAHIASEHEISHELEDTLNELIDETTDAMSDQVGRFRTDRRFITVAVGLFSGASLLAALALGAVLSWSVIRPVRKINHALGVIADGDFSHRVDVPNRDEFGSLSENVNRASEHLQRLYTELATLNRELEKKVEATVGQLERASLLRRYVSPQIAESILAGETLLASGSRRAELTVCFADIRGFTALSERVEPEEMVDLLNEFLSSMTEIVFEHGGTLDKYVGDALMVFFGDPVPFDDHAERAVRMAFAMQARLGEMRRQLLDQAREPISAGVGISTGFVTVGNIGSSSRMDYTVIGNHVNLASRLADLAEAGEILIGERTMAAVRDLVEAEEVDQVELKGVHRPVRYSRVLRVLDGQ